MSEDEYILARDLQSLVNAVSVLQGITPEISDIIPEDEYDQLMRKLRRWRREHYKAINTE